MPVGSTLITRHHLYIYLRFYSPLLDLGRFFSFLTLYKAGRTSRMGDEPISRPLPTHRAAQTQNKRTQTFMPSVGFEPTIPAFERAKAVHALDRAGSVISHTPPSHVYKPSFVNHVTMNKSSDLWDLRASRWDTAQTIIRKPTNRFHLPACDATMYYRHVRLVQLSLKSPL
jgi:hypothetical protein